MIVESRGLESPTTRSLLCQSHYVFMERYVMDNYDEGYLRIAEEKLEGIYEEDDDFL